MQLCNDKQSNFTWVAKQIYKNELIEILFDEKKSFLRYNAIANDNNTDKEFRDSILKYAEFIKKYKPDYLLLNMQNMHFLITPELQKWFAGVSEKAKIEGEVKKLALVLSTNFYAKLGLEQATEEQITIKEKRSKWENKYFDDIEKAEKWLFE